MHASGGASKACVLPPCRSGCEFDQCVLIAMMQQPHQGSGWCLIAAGISYCITGSNESRSFLVHMLAQAHPGLAACQPNAYIFVHTHLS